MYNLSKWQKIAIGVVLGFISFIIINYVYSKETTPVETKEIAPIEEEKEESTEETDQEETIKEENKEIIVHIAGAVQTEGIIFLNEGDRINTAIEKAGGTTQEADTTQINLATPVEDGMKIYIPKKGEKVENINEETTKETVSNKENTKTTSKININKATAEELDTLPGIGPSTAEKIVAYRKEKGKFSSKEEIKEVSGIGESKYNSIKDLINV